MENTNHRNKKTDKVFISFRGKDERNTFLSHLKQRLIDCNVNVFIDEDACGQPLPNLFKHIRSSKIAVVIFSPNYAESHWCLDELVEIKKCIETEKVTAVIPVFHKVKASNVKELSGEFGTKFLALQNRLFAKEGINEDEIKLLNSRIKKWKKALEFATGTIGCRYDINSPEAAFVETIVQTVKTTLDEIAKEEGHNIIQENSKIPEGKQQSPQIVFNIKELNINSQLLLDSLNLGKWNPQGYIMDIDMKTHSRVLRRTNSDLDQIYGPFPVEALIAQMKKVKNQGSIDNFVEKKPIGRTTCISYLSYCFCSR